LDLPDDQPILDQIEWADAEVARKQRSSDPVVNPPGFYIYLVRANYPVPADFETSRKQQAREESKRKDVESRAKEAQRELDLYEKRERYEAFLVDQTDAQLKNLSPASTERLLNAHKKRIKEESPQYQWSEATLRDFAVRRLRSEIAAELNLPSFEEYTQQPADRLF